MEDRRCLECSRHFSTTQALASHVKTHKSLNLALSVTNSPLSQSLPPGIVAPTSNSTYLEIPSQPANTKDTSANVSLAPSVSVTPGVNTSAHVTARPEVVIALPGDNAAALAVATSPSNSTFGEPATQTDSSQTTFTCDMCSRTLKTKSALIKHRVCLPCYTYQYLIKV